MWDKSSGSLKIIAEYGQEYGKENPIRVLYHGYGHYDALRNAISSAESKLYVSNLDIMSTDIEIVLLSHEFLGAHSHASHLFSLLCPLRGRDLINKTPSNTDLLPKTTSTQVFQCFSKGILQ
nr:isoform 2 of otu domain-containing protein [Quercus suber]